MYKLTAQAVEAFKKNRASIRIPVDLVSGDDIADITEADIKSLTLERTSVSGNSVAIGEARAFELIIELENWSGKFDGVNFDGAKIFPRVYTGAYSCPLGCFTIDGHENKSGRIKLKALDRMVLLDRAADISALVPITVKNLVLRACETCGVDASRANLNGACNADYTVKTVPEGVTWRQIVMWCGEIMGMCAYMDAEGYFRMAWYESTGLTITAADRFDHTLFQNDVVCTGVELMFDETIVQNGDCDGFTFAIEGNELIDYADEATRNALVANLGAKLNGFRHRPFSAETLPMPAIYPLDIMTYVDSKGAEYAVCITNYEYTLGDNTDLKGTGESETTSGYASLNPLTKREQRIVSTAVKKAEEESERQIGAMGEALTRLNELMANSLGLFIVEKIDANGGKTYYYADAPNLDDATIIYVFNAGGFAWTNDWNGGKPAWQYGVTKDGNAILNYLYTVKLTADYIDVETLVASGELKVTKDNKTIFRISEDGLEVNTDNFTLTKDGEITAKKGTIGGFTIEESRLYNGNGGSKIEILQDGYTTTFAGSYLQQTKQESAGGVTGISGWKLTPTDFYLSAVVSSTRTGLRLLTSYTKRSNYNAYDGKVTEVAEACITTAKAASFIVDTNSTINAAPFIIGIPRSVQKSPYQGVNEWGAYLRFDDYNSATLFYDSRVNGAWYIQDVATGNKVNLVEMVGFKTGAVTVSVGTASTNILRRQGKYCILDLQLTIDYKSNSTRIVGNIPTDFRPKEGFSQLVGSYSGHGSSITYNCDINTSGDITLTEILGTGYIQSQKSPIKMYFGWEAA